MGRLFKPRRKLRNGQAWISKKWYVEYRDAEGRQVRKPACCSKRESASLLRELQKRALRGKLGLEDTVRNGSKVKLSELVESYLRHVSIRVRERTLREYRDSLRDLLEGGMGNRNEPWLRAQGVGDLSLKMVLHYQEEASKELAPRSVNRKLKALLQCLNWAKRNKLIPSNPLEGVQLLPEHVCSRSRSFSDEEIERLLTASPSGVREVWEMFLETGMRKGELAARG